MIAVKCPAFRQIGNEKGGRQWLEAAPFLTVSGISGISSAAQNRVLYKLQDKS